MKSSEIRKLWKKFRESKQHKFLPEVNVLTSEQDKTTLFNQAGMQQLIPNFVGKPHKLGKRLYNIQKCIRTGDIDEVGDKSHLTFFEMMGNWSLGDYFKKESVEWSFEFLTKHLQINPKKLAITVFEGNSEIPRDNKTAEYREKVGINKDKISFLGTNDNRRSPGPIGPCGPDTEIFYRIGYKNGLGKFPPIDSNVKNDENNWMEIWNNVFMEFYRDENGKLNKLKSKNVDTGMGFERISSILQDKDTIFETDIFNEIIKTIEKYTKSKYGDNKRRIRIIADHLRTVSIIINDGGIISNTGSGYILKMLIRRMYYNLILLNKIDENIFVNFINEVIDTISRINNEKKLNTNLIKKNILEEIDGFRITITKGIKILNEKILVENKNIISGKDAFLLYDTYGFPIELTREICKHKNIKIDEQGFQDKIKLAKRRSREATKNMFNRGIDRSKYLEGISETEFIGYNCDQNSFNNKNIDAKLLKDFYVEGQRILIFDKTIFYAEGGGQTGDSGEIILNSEEKINIKDVKKYEGVFLHFVG